MKAQDGGGDQHTDQAASLETSCQPKKTQPILDGRDTQHLRWAPTKTAINKALQAERVSATLENCQTTNKFTENAKAMGSSLSLQNCFDSTAQLPYPLC
jgi:hypothetical protein